MSYLETVQQKILVQSPTLDVKIDKIAQQISIAINSVEISELKINVENNHIVSFDFVTPEFPIVNSNSQIDLAALTNLLNEIIATEN